VWSTPVGLAGRPHGRFALVGEELSGLDDRGEVSLIREQRLGREGAVHILEEQTERLLLGSLRSLPPEQALEPVFGTHRSTHLK
jgi:hypothetical protein